MTGDDITPFDGIGLSSLYAERPTWLALRLLPTKIEAEHFGWATCMLHVGQIHVHLANFFIIIIYRISTYQKARSPLTCWNLTKQGESMPSSWLNMHELDVVHMVLPLSNKINNKVIIFIPYGTYLTSTSPYIILLYVKRINLNPLHLYTTLKVNIVYFKQVVDHHFFS